MRIAAVPAGFALLVALGGCSISREEAWVLTGLEGPHREFRVYAADRYGDLDLEVLEVVRFKNAGTASLRRVLVEERLDWSLGEKLLAPPMAAAAIPVCILMTPVITVMQLSEGSEHPWPWYVTPLVAPLGGVMFAGGYLVSFVAFPVPLPPFTFPPFGQARDRQRFRPTGAARPATAEVREGETGLPVAGARVRVRQAMAGAEWSDWMETDWDGSVDLTVPGLDPAPAGTALEIEVEGETGLLRFPVTVREFLDVSDPDGAHPQDLPHYDYRESE